MAAAASYRSRAVGYEIDPELVRRSTAAVAETGLGDRVRIEHRDIDAVDLSEADVVAVYLVPNQLKALLGQYEKLKPGARIVSHQFKIPGVDPDQTITVTSTADGEPHAIHLWKAPLASPKE